MVDIASSQYLYNAQSENKTIEVLICKRGYCHILHVLLSAKV